MERSIRHTADRSPARGLVPAAVVVLLLALTACMPGMRLRTERGQPGDLAPGTYRMFLYGCSYPNRIENAVILAPESGSHRFEVYGPAFEYQVRSGVPRDEALKQAGEFLECSTYYRTSELRRVLGPSGAAAGYELRPLYSPVDFGRDDVLTINYTLTEQGRIVVFISLDQDIERALTGDGGPFLQDRDSNGGGGK